MLYHYFIAQVGMNCRLRKPCGVNEKCIDICDCPGYRCTGLIIIPINKITSLNCKRNSIKRCDISNANSNNCEQNL